MTGRERSIIRFKTFLNICIGKDLNSIHILGIGNIFFVYTKDQNSIPDELIFFRGVLING
jgi:hypothetical protein